MIFKSGISTNFWMSVIAFITITFNQVGVNIQPDDLISVVEAIQTKNITTIIIAVVGAVMMLYNTFKANKITGSIKDVIKHRNWWTGLIVLIDGIFVKFQLSGFPVEEAEQLVSAVFSGNITTIITGVWVLGQSLYFILRRNDPPTTTLAVS